MRGGEQRGLGVLGAVEVLLGPVPREPGDRLAKGGVGGGEDGGRGGGGLGEGAAHADGLAALAGEDEGDRGSSSVSVGPGSSRPESACTVAGIAGPSYARRRDDAPVTDRRASSVRRCARTAATPGGGPRPVRPRRGSRPARGAGPHPPPEGRPVAGHRARVRGRPVRPGGRGRDADPERPPDLRAGRDGPRAVARAGRRVRVTSSASSTSGSPSWPRCTCSRRARRRPSPTSPTPIGRSPSATSRLVDGLVKRRLVERRREEDDGRLRSVWLTARGQAVLRMVDRARAEQFLSAVRPMPRGERALIAMGVAALATHAISRRGRLVRSEG